MVTIIRHFMKDHHTNIVIIPASRGRSPAPAASSCPAWTRKSRPSRRRSSRSGPYHLHAVPIEVFGAASSVSSPKSRAATRTGVASCRRWPAAHLYTFAFEWEGLARHQRASARARARFPGSPSSCFVDSRVSCFTIIMLRSASI